MCVWWWCDGKICECIYMRSNQALKVSLPEKNIMMIVSKEKESSCYIYLINQACTWLLWKAVMLAYTHTRSPEGTFTATNQLWNYMYNNCILYDNNNGVWIFILHFRTRILLNQCNMLISHLLVGCNNRNCIWFTCTRASVRSIFMAISSRV